MITVQVLNDSSLVDNACELLYKVYIEEEKWIFSKNNPSLLRVEIKNGKKILTDRFVEKSVWFGAFDKSLLIGCIRLCGIDENNKLEVEGYKNSASIKSFLSKINKKSCMELGKACVDNKVANKAKIIKLLLLESFKYCEEKHYSVLTFTHNGYLKYLYSHIGYPLEIENAFRYEPHDPKEVNVYFASYRKLDVKHVLERLKYLESYMGTNEYNIFKALEITAPILPVPIYWHDREGVVLGINDRCLNAIGATHDIIGKTPYEFYPEETASHILMHNKKVIETGSVLSQEECIKDINTGETKYFAAIKAPLYDNNGNIMGIIGTSIDITAEKENESLKAKIEAQNIFKECIDKIHNDLETSRIKVVNSVVGNEKNTRWRMTR